MGEYGVESDQTSQVFPIVMGQPAITPVSRTANLNKINLVYGVYLQDTWQITDQIQHKFRFALGSRHRVYRRQPIQSHDQFRLQAAH